jgi:hypothetical protein
MQHQPEAGTGKGTTGEILFHAIFSRTSCFLNKPVTKNTFGVFW